MACSSVLGVVCTGPRSEAFEAAGPGPCEGIWMEGGRQVQARKKASYRLRIGSGDTYPAKFLRNGVLKVAMIFGIYSV